MISQEGGSGPPFLPSGSAHAVNIFNILTRPFESKYGMSVLKLVAFSSSDEPNAQAHQNRCCSHARLDVDEDSVQIFSPLVQLDSA